jgi:hypothetical protein
MPGSGTLSLPIMQKMRTVKLCESTTPSHTPGGLNQLGYATGGACQPIGENARSAAASMRSTAAGGDTAASSAQPLSMFLAGGASTGGATSKAQGSMLPLGDAGVDGGVCKAQLSMLPLDDAGAAGATSKPLWSMLLLGDAGAGGVSKAEVSMLPLGDAGADGGVGAVCRIQPTQPSALFLPGSSRATTGPQDRVGDLRAASSGRP